MHRRSFLKMSGSAAALATLGDFKFLAALPSVSAAETRLPPRAVSLHPDIEPLVRLLEETPRERVLEEVAHRIRNGTTYREVLAALLLAGVRNIQPRPVGFKFHAVLVVNSAHLASLASPEGDRWLPIFWAIDAFKNSQAQDVQQGDWTLDPVDEKAVPRSDKARQMLVDALDNWDEAAADAAIAGMARTASAHEIYEVLCRYGARDFREIGHKEIYVANSFRTLEAIGWHHAEPILRSLVYGILDRNGAKENPANADLAADRPYRKSLQAIQQIRDGWLDGPASAQATQEMLLAIRQGSSGDACDTAVKLLNSGASPQSLYDAFFAGAGELLMRAPGILALHAATFTNATHYSFQHCRDESTRKVLLLQNASFLPLFRGNSKDNGLHVEQLEPLASQQQGVGAIDEIFHEISHDRPTAARKIMGYLKDGSDPRPLAHAARRLIFLKGRDAHDYKFSCAVFEDFATMSAPWSDRYLAASVFNLKGSADKDNDLVHRTRAALNA